MTAALMQDFLIFVLLHPQCLAAYCLNYLACTSHPQVHSWDYKLFVLSSLALSYCSAFEDGMIYGRREFIVSVFCLYNFWWCFQPTKNRVILSYTDIRLYFCWIFKTVCDQHKIVKISSTKLHENPCSGSRGVPQEPYYKALGVALRNSFANTHNKDLPKYSQNNISFFVQRIRFKFNALQQV